jgi:peroxiredoxin
MEEDLTQYFLEKEKLLMVVSYNVATANEEGAANLKAIAEEAERLGYEIIGLSASGDIDKAAFKQKYGLDFDFYLCDEKALKTVVRSNPGVLTLERGTVTQKAHYNDLDKLILE